MNKFDTTFLLTNSATAMIRSSFTHDACIDYYKKLLNIITISIVLDNIEFTISLR